MTPKEFYLACDGYYESQDRQWDRKQIELYLLRFIGATLHNIGTSLSEGAKPIKPKDLIPLPLFDKTEESKDLNADRVKEIVKRDKRNLPDGFNNRTS